MTTRSEYHEELRRINTAITEKQAELKVVQEELTVLWEKEGPSTPAAELERQHVLDQRHDDLIDEITSLQDKAENLDEPDEPDPRPICS